MFRGPRSGRWSGSRQQARLAGRSSRPFQLAPGHTLPVQATAAILKQARIMARGR
jgi:hypothetical protein